MKYRPLPVELELQRIQKDQGDDAMRRHRATLFLQVASQPGFQLITAMLRDYESHTLNELRMDYVDVHHVHALRGRLKLIDNLRSSLAALLPAEQQPSVDWFDDAEEEYTGFIEKAAGRQE